MAEKGGDFMVALFVILTVVICIGVDSIIQWRRARKEAREVAPATAMVAAYAFEDLSVPAGVYLDSGHTWVEVEAEGDAHIGVDRFAESLLGRVDAVELPEVGREVHRGDRLFTLRQGARIAVFGAPIDGVVRSVDRMLARHPESMKADPYSAGWICRLAPKNLARNLKHLRIAEEARGWLKTEASRFQEFFAARPPEQAAMGAVMQDGGQPTGGILEWMDDETWRRFNDEFLRQHRGQ
jgi:glycine cleavage system H lipoate-binding protein